MIRLFNKIFFYRGLFNKSADYIACYDNKYRTTVSRGVSVNRTTGRVDNKYFKLEFIYPSSVCQRQYWKF